MAGLTGEEAYILARKYTQNTVMGGGAVVGKNVVVKSIDHIEGGNRITFGYTLDDGTEKESTLDVMDGVSPDIKENDGNTTDVYKLDIIDKNGTITTPNLKGEKGNQGERGLRGEPGERGERGEQGLPGLDGKDGVSPTVTVNDNDDGTITLDITDKDGTKTTPNLKGEKGDRGEQGLKGDRGEQGVQGVPGINGADGAPGVDGLPGQKGEKGDPGPKGDKGDDGYPFLIYKEYSNISEFKDEDFPKVGLMFMVKDEEDEEGYPVYRYLGEEAESEQHYSLVTKLGKSQAIKGDKGEPGEKGDKGDPGADGLPGRDGQDGKDGQPGKDGQNGKDGITYTPVIESVETGDSAAASVTVDNEAQQAKFSFTLPRGERGLQGLRGEQGIRGEKGEQGDGKINAVKVNGEELTIDETDKSVDIDLTPYALAATTGCSLDLRIDDTTYEMTLELKDKDGNVLSTGKVDLPLESVVVNADYAEGQLTLHLQNGTTLNPIDISDIVSGLVKDTFEIAGITMQSNISKEALISALGLSEVATSGSYNDLTDRPEIPTLPVILSTSEEVMANDAKGKVVDATVIKEINSGVEKYYKGTLNTGETEITIDIGTVTETTLIDIYTSIIGVNPTKIVQEDTTVKLTFASQESDMIVAVVTKDPVFK